jgi:hypothetical protein
MKRASSISGVLIFACAIGATSRLDAQSTSPWGRISFMAQSFSATESGHSVPGFSELILSATLASPARDEGGFEYRFDMRTAGYPQAGSRDARFSLYDGYVGQRFAGGTFGVRVGQMWLNDLGGLGSVGESRANSSGATWRVSRGSASERSAASSRRSSRRA